MASDEHLSLAGFVKAVHVQLREKTQQVGFEVAWSEHCKNYTVLNVSMCSEDADWLPAITSQHKVAPRRIILGLSLHYFLMTGLFRDGTVLCCAWSCWENYASSMASLATTFWDGSDPKESRIEWVHEACLSYFTGGGRRQQRDLEVRKLTNYGASVDLEISNQEECPTPPVHLLDVGSCFNPFKRFPLFRVLPIDIAPGHPDVRVCDFLNVPIVNEIINWTDSLTVDKLSIGSFDIIVFSLLLEYFPNSQLRFQCCQKAYALLKSEGLLIIITPDSKHATANAQIIKKWRIALASLGFWRMSYAKLKHLHCMTFRKTRNETFPRLWMDRELKKCQFDAQEPSSLMLIPQDKNAILKESESVNTTAVYERDNLAELFGELPGFNLI